MQRTGFLAAGPGGGPGDLPIRILARDAVQFASATGMPRSSYDRQEKGAVISRMILAFQSEPQDAEERTITFLLVCPRGSGKNQGETRTRACGS